MGRVCQEETHSLHFSLLYLETWDAWKRKAPLSSDTLRQACGAGLLTRCQSQDSCRAEAGRGQRAQSLPPTTRTPQLPGQSLPSIRLPLCPPGHALGRAEPGLPSSQLLAAAWFRGAESAPAPPPPFQGRPQLATSWSQASRPGCQPRCRSSCSSPLPHPHPLALSGFFSHPRRTPCPMPLGLLPESFLCPRGGQGRVESWELPVPHRRGLALWVRSGQGGLAGHRIVAWPRRQNPVIKKNHIKNLAGVHEP